MGKGHAGKSARCPKQKGVETQSNRRNSLCGKWGKVKSTEASNGKAIAQKNSKPRNSAPEIPRGEEKLKITLTPHSIGLGGETNLSSKE